MESELWDIIFIELTFSLYNINMTFDLHTLQNIKYRMFERGFYAI